MLEDKKNSHQKIGKLSLRIPDRKNKYNILNYWVNISGQNNKNHI